MNNYSLYPRASQDGEASFSRSRVEEPVSVEEAMRRHDGLVHAFIQRQGGGAIPYEEALPSAVRTGLRRQAVSGSGGPFWATIRRGALLFPPLG